MDMDFICLYQCKAYRLGRIEKSKSSNMNLTQMGFKVAHKMKAIL